MPTFAYSARSKDGEKAEGHIEAADKRAALAQLEQQGYVPISVSLAGAIPEARQKTKPAPKPGRKRMSRREVLTFTTELSDLLASGMTLGRALDVLGSRDNSGSTAVIRELHDDIVQGASLSRALSKHPRSFGSLYVSMIRSGEASGALSDVLVRLVDHYERMYEVREKVVTAMVYPVIVLMMGLLTLFVCTFLIIPKFEPILVELGGTMPMSTKILMSVSRWLLRYGLVLIGIGVALVTVARRAARTKRGELWWHGFLLRVPFVRSVVAANSYTNFARTLGTLLSNGVPVLDALAIVQHTVGNAVIAQEIHNARERVTDGSTISGPLAEGHVFPRMMTDMLSVGEQTGNIAGTLPHIVRRYNQELDRSLKILTTVLEPLLISVIAVLVGFVAYGLWAAVSSMTSGMNMGA